MDAGDNTEANQYNNALDGYYFVPLYNLSVVDGSVVLLLTVAQSGVLAAQNYTFTPILNLPTGGSGEKNCSPNFIGCDWFKTGNPSKGRGLIGE